MSASAARPTAGRSSSSAAAGGAIWLTPRSQFAAATAARLSAVRAFSPRQRAAGDGTCWMAERANKPPTEFAAEQPAAAAIAAAPPTAVGATTAAEDARGGLNLDVFVPIRQLIEAMRETREVTCLLPWQRDCLLVSRSPTGGNGASSCLGEDAAQSSAASEAAESGASERGDASSAASAAAVAAGIALRWGAKAALAAESQRILDGSLNLVYSAPTGAGKTLVSEVLMLRHIFGLLRLPPRDTQQKELEYQEQPRQLSWPTAPRATPAATAEEVGKSLLSSPQVSDGSAGDAVPPRRVIVVLPFVSLIEEQQQKLQRLFAAASLPIKQPWQEVTLPSPLTPLLPHLLHRQGEKQQEWQNPHYKVQAELSRPLVASAAAREPLLRVLLLLLLQDDSVLIFCRSKAAAEAVALLVADYVMPLLQQRIRMPQHPKEQHGFLSAAAADLRMRRINNVAVLQGGTIKSTVAFAAASGVSIHHAALTVEEKRLAVSFFKEGLVKVLTATSTLAAGVNFPCDSVLFDSPHVGSGFLDAAHYKQMAGRAGRMQDKSRLQSQQQQKGGRAIVLCKASEVERVKELLLQGPPSVQSALGGERQGLQRLILGALSCSSGALRCSGSNTELALLACCTFLVLQHRLRLEAQVETSRAAPERRDHQLSEIVQREIVQAVAVLLRLGLVRFAAGHYEATAKGRAIASVALSPEDGAAACACVAAASSRLALHDDIPLVYLVAPTLPLPQGAAEGKGGETAAAGAALTADDLRHLERTLLRMQPSERLALDHMGVGLQQLREFMLLPRPTYASSSLPSVIATPREAKQPLCFCASSCDTGSGVSVTRRSGAARGEEL
ncbi:uncharacterized protein LOC113146919 [Cyclospora cayetanensis]|uniref:Uncharacterized protein LOC113146919 n=1 Tax=Cyclospora cayetanensis TaxID=88456 RepID=A0A6P6RUH4_9EIME|nr:uncharacterized protein LOC113146919 [Cyclospora cayetanensis]